MLQNTNQPRTDFLGAEVGLEALSAAATRRRGRVLKNEVKQVNKVDEFNIMHIACLHVHLYLTPT